MTELTDPKVVLGPWLVGNVSEKGEQRLRCPIHGDNNPSASVNWKKNLWNCMGCDAKGTLKSLVQQVASGRVTQRQGHARQPNTTASTKPLKPISIGRVAGYHSALMDNEKRLAYLMEERMLTRKTIVQHQLGWDSFRSPDHKNGLRYTLPVFDEAGNVVNIRRYRGSKMQAQKFLNEDGYGIPPRLYPAVPEDALKVVVFEGEFDALVGSQVLDGTGFVATTGTHGAGTWDHTLSEPLRGKEVWICYDNDDIGRKKGAAISRMLLEYAKAVYIIEPVSGQDKGDITDWMRDEGGTKKKFLKAIEDAKEVVSNKRPDKLVVQPVDSTVRESMDAVNVGKPLRMEVTVIAQRDPTYVVPKIVLASCDMNNGKSCERCTMNTLHNGTFEIKLDTTDPTTVLKFIDVDEAKIDRQLRRMAGAPLRSTCQRIDLDIEEATPVEELFVMPTIDSMSEGEADNTQRRVYSTGTHATRMNSTAFLTGAIAPNPKTQRNEFVGWNMELSQTSLDSFEMTPVKMKALSVFQTKPGQRPLTKMREIAHDLGANVSHIIGRERMHMAMDLVFHSVLHFPFDGKIISKGWVELLVAGETRTGKSAAAIALAKHYRAGRVVNCENVSLAGIMGGVSKASGSDAWITRMGELPRQDGRMCILDEVSGAPTSIIGALSDVRSRGVAQISKIESAEFPARVRLIFVGNERVIPGAIGGIHMGTELVKNLMGAPEDISRLDIAMTVRTSDVKSEAINDNNRPKVKHVYTSDLCHDLVMWAWSRKSHHVQWEPGVEDLVREQATYLGDKYIDDPPLIQAQSVREKIARLSVAMAARVFSTDKSGEMVVVKKSHVIDAVAFIDELYEYPNFGYARTSLRKRRSVENAKANRKTAEWLLRANDPVLRFFIGRNGKSFRADDLRELADMDHGSAETLLSELHKIDMIDKDKSQIVFSQEMIDILRRLEDGQH